MNESNPPRSNIPNHILLLFNSMMREHYEMASYEYRECSEAKSKQMLGDFLSAEIEFLDEVGKLAGLTHL